MWLLAQVDAPHFCAGIVLHDDVVVEAAPILAWTVGRHRSDLRAYFERRGWTVRARRCRPKAPCKNADP